ncbi:kinase-like domain-containing protein [Lasiosphaeria miniovina]|uniref:Kinase-like domain-containing protein n=1 Tax=Lasiosphaeria miniovina TaxID=1954250 RepID=A0AA40A543_9PEZI|nr:kinase-like domain-containing protein [Lasiosphaeria miniovina]KAK0709321.1 kinase-like domain-containing protein [Lasiosphaeria miniovina]
MATNSTLQAPQPASDNDVIFTLTTSNPTAKRVCGYTGNKNRVKKRDDGEFDIVVSRNQQAPARPGILLSFGHDKSTNDIELFSNRNEPGPVNHCCFFLAQSGELIFRDLAEDKRTKIIIDYPHCEQTMTQLIEFRKRVKRLLELDESAEIRQGVIPTIHSSNFTKISNAKIIINLGDPDAKFEFNWGPMGDYKEFKKGLKTEADKLKFEYTSGILNGIPEKFFCYSQLGRGAAGTVYKVVDMLNGRIKAIKVRNDIPASRASKASDPKYDENARKCFEQEIETIKKLKSHPPNEHIIGYTIDNMNRIWMPWYSGGSIMERFPFLTERFLLPNGTNRPDMHDVESCETTLPIIPPWSVDLEVAMFSALSHLKKYNIIHHDINPMNILCKDLANGRKKFVLADFSYSQISDPKKGAAGWRENPGRYDFAPETTLKFKRPAGNRLDELRKAVLAQVPIFPAMDIYSLGHVFLQNFRYTCGMDFIMTEEQWCRRLDFLNPGRKSLGARGDFTDPVKNATEDDDEFRIRRWHSRIRSLINIGCLPPLLARMLAWDPAERVSVEECLDKIKEPHSRGHSVFHPLLNLRPESKQRAAPHTVLGGSGALSTHILDKGKTAGVPTAPTPTGATTASYGPGGVVAQTQTGPVAHGRDDGKRGASPPAPGNPNSDHKKQRIDDTEKPPA